MTGHGFSEGDRVTLTRINPNGADGEVRIPFSVKTQNATLSKVSGTGSFVSAGVEAGDEIYTADDRLVGVVKTVSDTVTLTEPTDVALSGATGCYVLKNIGGIPSSEFFGKTYSVKTVKNRDEFTFKASQNATVTGNFGGEYALSTRAIPFDIVQPTVNYQSFSETPISFWMRVSDVATSATEQGIVNINDNNYFTKSKKISATKTAMLNVTMSTNNSSISPVVDSERVSLLTVKNEFDLSSDVGESNAQYITKEVRLTNVSTMLKVMFAYSLPQLSSEDKTDIVVRYKAYMNGNEPADWTEMNTENGNSLTSTDIGSTIFYDASYVAEKNISFDTFKLNIVFRGKNTCAVPKIEQLRILACE